MEGLACQTVLLATVSHFSCITRRTVISNLVIKCKHSFFLSGTAKSSKRPVSSEGTPQAKKLETDMSEVQHGGMHYIYIFTIEVALF